MTVNGQEIGFSILPEFDKVHVTIYRVWRVSNGEPINLKLIEKTFGGMFRKPNENDYIKARKWLENQMFCIESSNRKLT